MPVLVCDAAYKAIAGQPACGGADRRPSALPRRERDIAWRVFTRAPTRVVRTDDELAAAEVMHVADLRNAFARHPDDEELCSLIDELRETSPGSPSCGSSGRLPAPARRKTFRHPEVGELTLDCEALSVQGSDLELIVYTAPPGSPDAAAPALLATIGLQSF